MNRSLAAKHDRAKLQRIEAGQKLGAQFFSSDTYRVKSAVRAELAQVQLVPKNCNARTTIEPSDVVMVPYMPHRAPKKLPLARLCQIYVPDELIKSFR